MTWLPPSLLKVDQAWIPEISTGLEGVKSTILDPALSEAMRHSGRYGHNNETPILQSFGCIKQFYTYFIPYDMN